MGLETGIEEGHCLTTIGSGRDAFVVLLNAASCRSDKIENRDKLYCSGRANPGKDSA
jgi:hypothetical protein